VAAVLIAVLGVIGTLSGVALGARQEQRRWLRDKRLDAYVSFDNAVHAFDVAWSRQTEKPDAHELMAAFSALNAQRDRVLLVAPPDVRLAAVRVVEVATRAAAAFGRRARAGDGAEAMLRFIDVVSELQQAQRLDVQGSPRRGTWSRLASA